MISYLRGKVVFASSPVKKGAFVIVDVNGIGYRVTIPLKHLERYPKDAAVELYTFHHVWENGQELFGFPKKSDADFFSLLTEIPGIGTKTALNILHQAEIHQIQNAVIADDPEMLFKTSGISKKTSEKIILGLRDHLKKMSYESSVEPVSGGSYEVIDALMSLGFSREAAQEAFQSVPKNITTSEEKIKEALKILGKKK